MSQFGVIPSVGNAGLLSAMRAAVVPLDVEATIAAAWIADARSAPTSRKCCAREVINGILVARLLEVVDDWTEAELAFPRAELYR